MFDSREMKVPAARRVLVLLLSLLLCAGSPGRAQELKLPNLGESSTSMFSAEFEHQLGRT